MGCRRDELGISTAEERAATVTASSYDSAPHHRRGWRRGLTSGHGQAGADLVHAGCREGRGEAVGTSQGRALAAPLDLVAAERRSSAGLVHAGEVDRSGRAVDVDGKMRGVMMPEAGTPFTPTQNAAVHVAYSIGFLGDLNGPLCDQLCLPVVRNACLESFFVNLRLCIEFIARSPNDKDIHARMFLPDWSFSDPELNRLWDLASKHVAHLSFKRLDALPDSTDEVSCGALRAHVSKVVEPFDTFTDRLAEYELEKGVTMTAADTFRLAIQDVKERWQLP